jgi:Uma2 family endonuclease
VETAQTQEVARRRRFTVHEYHRMAEAGILHEDDRVELIEGEIVEMSPIGGRHAKCVIELMRLLVPVVGEEARVSPQNPVRLGDYGEPQPDIAVLRISERYRAGELSESEDVLLLVEVSDTSLRYDREIKLPLYARAVVREVWIVDLANEAIERHTEPTGDGYRLTERARRGETLRSKALPELVVPVDALLD